MVAAIASLVRSRTPVTAVEVEECTGSRGIVTGATDDEAAVAASIAAAEYSATGDGGVPGIGGRVTDAGGRAVSAAALTLVDHHGHQYGRTGSRDDGGYALPLPPPGQYVLITAADTHRPHATPLSVGARPIVHDVVLSGGTSLFGRVLAQGDTTVPGATIVVIDVHGEVVGTATSDVDGGYMVAGLFPGTFTLTAHAPGYRPTAASVAVGAEDTVRCDLALAYAAAISGTVRHDSTDSPIPDARITLLAADGTVVATAVSDQSGAYTFADLIPGDYTLCASGHPPVSAVVTLNGAGDPNLDLHFDTPSH
ncbi:MSCRAMM family protein [Nocardia miyunensis]|uniref:MSCRAMM family protein n=1 Tax=Nocardia miyunensis TaxID=282684 RepID=UPI001FE16DFA|nr:carboxypeptidase-like regulatory domain-containing protein [Nocardia miyunensis]